MTTGLKSKFEEEIYKQLVRRYGKENVEYEPIKLPYVVDYTYTPDFRVLTPNESDEALAYFI